MDPSGREKGLVYCTEAWRPAPRRAVGFGAALLIAGQTLLVTCTSGSPRLLLSVGVQVGISVQGR